MMRDQADELRNLVLRANLLHAAPGAPAPRLVVVSGGKGGVGATTLALNLAVGISQQGRRVVLVDADLHRADVAALCGIEPRYSIADVLAARRDIHEVLERGPAGIQIAPGAWAPARLADCSATAQRRLLQQIKALGRFAEVVLLDAGSGPSDAARRYWLAADEVVLVTTPEIVAVMDAYATVKVLLSESDTPPRLRTLVNQTVGKGETAPIHQRIQISCRRFLNLQTQPLGEVPLDEHVSAAATLQTPVLAASPRCDAARAIERIAAQMAAEDREAAPAEHQSRHAA